MKIFHHNDMDGIMSAAFIKKTYDSAPTHYIPVSDEDCIACGYTEKNKIDISNVEAGETIYIVDYSFSETTYPILRNLLDMACNVYWIDHHSTSYDLVHNHPEILEDPNLHAIICVGYSGAVLCFAYAHRLQRVSMLEFAFMKDILFTTKENMEMEKLIHFLDVCKSYAKEHLPKIMQNPSQIIDAGMVVAFLVDDYDCWKFEFGDITKEFKLGFDANYATLKYPARKEACNLTCASWLLNQAEEYRKAGEPILKYIKSDLRGTLKSIGYFTYYNGMKCLVVNRLSNSWIYESCEETYDMGVSYNYDGESFKYTLTSPEYSKVNCAQFAESFGGGGHVHAAGFSSKDFIFKKVDLIE